MARRRYRHKYRNPFHRPGFVIVALVALVIYSYLCWRYVVRPYNLRWKARYGVVTVPPGYSTHGIDISHHQGVIDWSELAKASLNGSRLTFVMIKGTEGRTILDKRFAKNFKNAYEENYIRGVYHFFTPRENTAEAQAQNYINHIKLQKGDLPPILDIETIGDLSADQLRKEAKKWLDICEKHYGCTPILYTNLKFHEDYLYGEEFERYPFWIAHYYVNDVGYNGPWKIWQHTDCGHVPGITGDVDLNVFNGSKNELKKLCIK